MVPRGLEWPGSGHAILLVARGSGIPTPHHPNHPITLSPFSALTGAPSGVLFPQEIEQVFYTEIGSQSGIGRRPGSRSRRSGEDETHDGTGTRGGPGHRPDRAPVRQGLDHEDEAGRDQPDADRGDPDREHRARSGARHRRRAARPDRRDLRPGVVRQDDAGPAHHRRGPEAGRHGGDHRRRARPRPDLRRPPGRQPRRAADLAAGHRRAGAGDRRDAGPLRRARRRS